LGSGGASTARPLSLHDTYFEQNKAAFGGGLMVDAALLPPRLFSWSAMPSAATWPRCPAGALPGGAGSLVTVSRQACCSEHLANTGAGGGHCPINARLLVIDSSVTSNTAGSGGGVGCTSPPPGRLRPRGRGADLTTQTIHRPTLLQGGAWGGGIKKRRRPR